MFFDRLSPELFDEVLSGFWRRQQQFERVRQMVTPEMAMRAVSIAQNFPTIPRGLVQAATMADMPDEMIAQVAPQFEGGGHDWLDDLMRPVGVGFDAAKWAGSHVFEYGLKPGLRSLVLAGDTAYHEVVGRNVTAGFMAAYDGPGGTTFGDARREYGNSAGVTAFADLQTTARHEGLGAAVGRAFQDDDPDTEADESFLGTGFLPGGIAQNRSDEQRTLTIDGQRASVGTVNPVVRSIGAAGNALSGWEEAATPVRSFGKWISPGEGAYNFVAGLTNLTAEVFADPVSIFLGGSPALGNVAGKATTAAGRLAGFADEAVKAGDDVAEFIALGRAGRIRKNRTLSMSDAEQAVRDSVGEANAMAADVIALGEPDVYESLARNAGLIDGVRKSVLADRAEAMLLNEKVLDVVADMGPHDIYLAMKRSPANHIDADLLQRMGAATTREDVAEVIIDGIRQGNIGDARILSGVGKKYGVNYNFRPVFDAMRKSELLESYRGDAPFGTVFIADKVGSAGTVDEWMATAKIDKAQRAEVFERALNAETQDDLYHAALDGIERFVRTLDGVDEDVVQETMRLYRDNAGEQVGFARAYALDEGGAEMLAPGGRSYMAPKGDEFVEIHIPEPHYEAQLANAGFHMPSPVETRRLTQRVAKVEALRKAKGWTGDSLRSVNQKWKIGAVGRLAYVPRVLPEEQARIAADGLSSIVGAHPLQWVKANVMARTDEVVFTEGRSLEEMAEQYGAIVREATGTMDDLGRHKAGGRAWVTARKGATVEESGSWLRGWRISLQQMAASSDMRVIARTNGDTDAFLRWTQETKEGASWLRRMRQSTPGKANKLSTDDGVREYATHLHRILLDQIGGKADGAGIAIDNGADALRRGIADGSFVSDTDALNAATRQHFNAGPVHVAAPKKPRGIDNKIRDSVVDTIMEHITGKPTKYASRIPAFRQYGLRNMTENLDGLANDALRAKFVEGIRSTMKLLPAEEQALMRALRQSKGKVGPIDDLELFSDIVWSRAGAQAKELLYDVTARSKVQAQHELIVPFYDAWLEVASRWTRFMRDNPSVIQRFANGYQSLEDSNVIYANDNGDKVFNYPLPQAIARRMPGAGGSASMELQARVEGLNLVASSPGPGFGPVVNLLAGASGTLDDPGLESLREFVLPYGSRADSPEDVGNPNVLIESFTPAWASKALTALTRGEAGNKQQYLSTAGDVIAALSVSRPDLDPGDREDAEEIERLALNGAQFLMFLRMALQFTLPTGPTVEYEIEEWDPEGDPEGRWVFLDEMRSAYYDILEQVDYDSQRANAQFTLMYGHEPYNLVFPKSVEVRESPVTREGAQWIERHAEEADKYDDVAAWFIPADEAVGDFDPTAYFAAFARGDRQSPTVEEMNQARVSMRAYAIYYNARDVLEANETLTARERRNMLDNVAKQLDRDFADWRMRGGESTGSKADLASQIRQMEQAVEDRAFADSPVYEPLSAYLEVRRRAEEMAQERNGMGLGAQDNADLAEYLRSVGVDLGLQSPDFNRVWNEMLIREFD